MKPWRRTESRRVKRCGIFDLDEVRFEPPDGGEAGWFHVLDAPDWINVIALTEEERVVMVRQFRFGIDDLTLEIPGGMCDPSETPADAARRELREETGYESGELVELGWVHPNPPVQNNRCFTFLARGVVETAEQQPDPHERIQVVTQPLSEIPRLIGDGTITHALVLAAFQLYGLKTPSAD